MKLSMSPLLGAAATPAATNMDAAAAPSFVHLL